MKPNTILTPCPECQTTNPFLIFTEAPTGETYDLSTAPMHILDDINKNGPVTCSECHTEYVVKLTLETTITTSIVTAPPEEEIDEEIPESLRGFFS